MKRNATIKANGGDVCLEVDVRIEAHNLTRDQVQACIESAASAKSLWIVRRHRKGNPARAA